MILALLFNAVLLATCLFALIRGGRPERIGAGINLIASFGSTFLRLENPHFFLPGDVIDMLIDLAVVAGFFSLAVSTTRFWPVWACGFALADVVMSVAGRMLPHVPLIAYHTGLGIYAYLALLAMTLGTMRLPQQASLQVRQGMRP